jgi:hypothetical protein
MRLRGWRCDRCGFEEPGDRKMDSWRQLRLDPLVSVPVPRGAEGGTPRTTIGQPETVNADICPKCVPHVLRGIGDIMSVAVAASEGSS